MTDTQATPLRTAEDMDLAGSADWIEAFTKPRNIVSTTRHVVHQALIFLALLGPTATTSIAGSFPPNLIFSVPPALESLNQPSARRRMSRKEVIKLVMQILEDADRRRLYFAEEEATRQFEIP